MRRDLSHAPIQATPELRLREVDSLELPVRRPFNFQLTFWKPSHFETGLEAHADGASWRTFRFGPTVLGARFEEGRSCVRARVFASGRWNPELRDRLTARVDRAYGLREDLDDFTSRAKELPALAGAVERLRGMRISCPESLFEIAIVSLLLQNTTISRTTQMFRNVLDAYGGFARFDGLRLRYCCSPAELEDAVEDDLRARCRLGYRARYLPELARFFARVDDDELRAADRETVLRRLQEIRGVGPYTAGVIASHALRDPDALALDVWNRKIAARAFLGCDDAPASAIRECMLKALPGYAGLALLYLVEDLYSKMETHRLAPAPVEKRAKTTGSRPERRG